MREYHPKIEKRRSRYSNNFRKESSVPVYRGSLGSSSNRYSNNSSDHSSIPMYKGTIGKSVKKGRYNNNFKRDNIPVYKSKIPLDSEYRSSSYYSKPAESMRKSRYNNNKTFENVPMFKISDKLNLDFKPNVVNSKGYESVNHVPGKRYSNRNLMIDDNASRFDSRGYSSGVRSSSGERRNVESAFRDSGSYVSGSSRKFLSSYYGGVRHQNESYWS